METRRTTCQWGHNCLYDCEDCKDYFSSQELVPGDTSEDRDEFYRRWNYMMNEREREE